MVYVEFGKRSLLYGHSCYWLIITTFITFYWMPNLKTTKTRHVLSDFPYLKLVANLFEFVRRVTNSKYIIRKIIITLQLLYATIYCIISCIVQDDFLKFLGKTHPEELSYKVLYYTPIAYVSR